MMAQQLRRLNADTDIDWNSDGHWVQDYGLVRRESDNGAIVTLRRQDGSRFTLPCAEFEARYHGTVRDEVFKPAHAPLQAWIAMEPVELVLNRKTVVLDRGDALLRDLDGRLSTLTGPRFMAGFRAMLDSDIPH